MLFLTIRVDRVVSARLRTVCVLLGIATLLSAFLGCGHSQAETAKEDVQGRQMNDVGAKRMMQERTGTLPQTGNNGQ
ncbi:MAG: hypothetical protein JWL77_3702 [Chthonomonadaceae bacterium]|nr:hypothetical protein [Chthonomonadaceae bacterium]